MSYFALRIFDKFLQIISSENVDLSLPPRLTDLSLSLSCTRKDPFWCCAARQTAGRVNASAHESRLEPARVAACSAPIRDTHFHACLIIMPPSPHPAPHHTIPCLASWPRCLPPSPRSPNAECGISRAAIFAKACSYLVPSYLRTACAYHRSCDANEKGRKCIEFQWRRGGLAL